MERHFFNSKEKKEFFKRMEKHYGIDELKLDTVIMKDQKGKIYLISNKFKDINEKDFRIASYGLYFATDINELRLSIEGSQIIGKLATKNILELNETQIKKWMQGQDIDFKNETEGFFLIKHKKDFYGCGKYKNGIIMNYVPKDRRIKFE
ncbi:MAG: hypothetical protein PHE43_02375 [Candidatus Nanoarchaeia archaeon]|nr:hypothetical protein [Candidatus Nanoarchaeia archaeon]